MEREGDNVVQRELGVYENVGDSSRSGRKHISAPHTLKRIKKRLVAEICLCAGGGTTGRTKVNEERDQRYGGTQQRYSQIREYKKIVS